VSVIGILSLNLKIEKSYLETVDDNLKSTAATKNDQFPIPTEEYLQIH